MEIMTYQLNTNNEELKWTWDMMCIKEDSRLTIPDEMWRIPIRLPSSGRGTLGDNVPYNGYAYLIQPTPIAVAAQTGHYDPNLEWPSDLVFLRHRTLLRLSDGERYGDQYSIADSC